MDGPGRAVLRPALELAWAVARADAERVPPVTPPAGLRPLLRFARLPERALDTVRTVVDTDEAFRARVAAVADAEGVGRVGWLWLARPDGWTDELEAAASRATAAPAAEAEERAERRAARRLPAVESRLADTEAALAAASARAEQAGEQVAAERAVRRRSEEALEAVRAELNGARRDRDRLEGALARTEAALAETDQALRSARRDLGLLERRRRDTAARADGLRRQLDEAAAELEQVRRRAAADERAEQDRRASVMASLAGAARAASDLGAALADAAGLLSDPAGTRPPPPSLPAPDPRRSPAPGPAGRPRREPLRLPPGIWDDSLDAALFLLQAPGAVLLVDGYNVTLGVWPGVDLHEQRHRLVSALGEVALRTGLSVEVVFDGAGDTVSVARGPGGRDPVRVVFSPAGVDADDVIIERTRRLPPTSPVVVATDDRRIRDAVVAVGANVIGTGQLVEALGRRSGR